MGNCSLQADRGEVYKEVGKCDFTFKQIVGRGGFGKVTAFFVLCITNAKRKGLESGKEKGQKGLCYERNVEGSHIGETLSFFRYE